MRIASTLLIASLVLAGCGGTTRTDLVRTTAEVAASGGANENSVAVGNDLVGEACRAVPSSDVLDALGASKVLDVKCGNWTRPSGRVAQIDHAAKDRDELVQLATGGIWRNDLDSRMICADPKDTQILDGKLAIWLKCSRRAGGLPHVAFATSLGGKIFLADGLPPSQAAMERLAGLLGGLLKADEVKNTASTSSSATELLKEQFGGRLVGNADRANYDRLMQLGRAFNNEGSFSQAANYYRDALKLQQQLLGANNPDAAQPMMHLAVVLSNSQRFTEATTLFNRAGDLLEKSTDAATKAMYVYYRAVHEANQSHRDEALALSRQAIKMFQDLGGTNTTRRPTLPGQQAQLFSLDDASDSQGARKVNFEIGLIESASIAARMERRSGAVKQSQQTLDETRSIAEKSSEKAPDSFANVLQISGQNSIDLGNPARGEQETRQAVAQLDKHLANTPPQARAYFTLGTVLRRQNKTVEALGAFRTGAQIAKTKSFTFPVEIIFPYMDALYDEAKKDPKAETALFAEMFEASQLAKSGAASQFVADAAAQLAQGSGEGSTAIREYREKQADVERLQNKVDGELALPAGQQDPIELKKLVDQLRQAEKDKDEAEGKVQVLAPNFNMLRLKTIRAEDVLKTMRGGEAVYFIQVGPQWSYAFLIHDGKITAFRVDLSFQSARETVGAIREASTVHISATGEPLITDFDVDGAYKLYQQLLGPVQPQLEGVKKLIVAQTGALLSLPFGLLVDRPLGKPIDGLDYTGVSFLIKRFAIGYVTSMQSFVILREGATSNRGTKPFAGFGDYVQPPADFFRTRMTDPNCKQDLESMIELGPLPGTRPEVTEIAHTMGAGPQDILLGQDFTKKRMLEMHLQDYRILHFATHALLPTDLACRSSPTMLVSPPSGDADLTDIFFETRDVLKLQLNADLVVLSACNTSSQGEVGSGESLSGLAQAFFVAGARGLIVSHWLAADQSTQQLMTSLYKEIAKKTVDTANALRNAQIDMIEQSGKQYPLLFSHPLFWAVFTPMGDGFQPSTSAALVQ